MEAMTTTLMPQKPGHWTEYVLLALPDAVLSNDEPGVPAVTLTLEPDLEVEFREVVGEKGIIAAVLQEIDKDHSIASETVLYEDMIGKLLEWIMDWFDAYIE